MLSSTRPSMTAACASKTVERQPLSEAASKAVRSGMSHTPYPVAAPECRWDHLWLCRARLTNPGDGVFDRFLAAPPPRTVRRALPSRLNGEPITAAPRSNSFGMACMTARRRMASRADRVDHRAVKRHTVATTRTAAARRDSDVHMASTIGAVRAEHSSTPMTKPAPPPGGQVAGTMEYADSDTADTGCPSAERWINIHRMTVGAPKGGARERQKRQWFNLFAC